MQLKLIVRLAVVLLVATGSLRSAQQPGLKLYISVDMEGIGGVVNPADACVEPDPDCEMFRRAMTAEVNAAIESALQAGFNEILLEEHHGARGFRNILLGELNPRAKLLRGWPRPRGGVSGLDSSFAAAMFIGYHAREGTPKAVLAHTFLDFAVADFRINGRSIGEGEFNAIVAGALGVPVIMVAGDDGVVKQLRDFLGDVEGAVVKEAVSRTATVAVPPAVSAARVKEAAARALGRRSQFRPVRLEVPYRAEFTFKPPWDERIERIVKANPEISRPEPRKLARTCQNVDELLDFYVKALDVGMESPPQLKR